MNQKVNILSPTGVKILEHTLSENDVRKFTLMTEDYIQLSFHSQQALASRSVALSAILSQPRNRSAHGMLPPEYGIIR